jgi:hypothetical protein
MQPWCANPGVKSGLASRIAFTVQVRELAVADDAGR